MLSVRIFLVIEKYYTMHSCPQNHFLVCCVVAHFANRMNTMTSSQHKPPSLHWSLPGLILGADLAAENQEHCAAVPNE